MYKSILFILTLLLLQGCGGYQSYKTSNYIDPEFKEYVDAYVTDAYSYGIVFNPPDFNVVFGITDVKDNATCSIREFKQKNFDGSSEDVKLLTITVDIESWDRFGFFAKKALIYHESNHCLNNFRGHRDDKISLDGLNLKKSIMNTYDFSSKFSSYYLEVYWSNYVHELFTGEWE